MKTEKPSHFTDSKRNPFKRKMTDAGRAGKHRTAAKTARRRLTAVLGQASTPSNHTAKPSLPQLLDMAAARLESVGKHNPVAAFEFAAGSYLRELVCQSGNVLPVDSLFEQLLELVAEFNPELAQTFAANCKLPFLWCVVGHVHRLSMEYARRPEAIQTIEIYRKGKRTTSVAVRRDGKKFVLLDGDYSRHDPWVCFAGTQARPPLSATDFKRLERMDAKRALTLLESGKFQFTYPNSAVFASDHVLNVARPLKLDGVRRYLSALRPLPTHLARKLSKT